MLFPKRTGIGALFACVIVAIAAVFALRKREPTPALQLPIPSQQVWDLQIAPDGRQIAAITVERGAQNSLYFPAKILEYPSGKDLRTFPNVVENGAAWNGDGSKFAAGSDNGYSLDVLDARSWKVERHLSVGSYDYEKMANSKLGFEAVRFDDRGNIFCAQFVNGEDVPAALQAKVWWPENTKAEGIGSNEKPFDLAVASAGDSTRLVISYQFHNKPSPVDVWSVLPQADGRRAVKREYQVPDLFSAKLALTKDGKTLLARDESKLRIYELRADHAESTHSLDAARGEDPNTLRTQKLVVSPDGRFAAFTAGARAVANQLVGGRVVVIRVPQGDILSEWSCQATALAFLPDSGSLAAADRERKAILVYRVDGG